MQRTLQTFHSPPPRSQGVTHRTATMSNWRALANLDNADVYVSRLARLENEQHPIEVGKKLGDVVYVPRAEYGGGTSSSGN